MRKEEEGSDFDDDFIDDGSDAEVEDVPLYQTFDNSDVGENILLLSPLLRNYLDMGLVVTSIEFVIEYNVKCVFKWFMNEVVNDRRMADLNPEYTVRGETSKTKGNSGYGRTLMNKFAYTKLTFTKGKMFQNTRLILF